MLHFNFKSGAAKKENKGNRPVIQLDAHSDAVGFITQAVRPNGLIKFVPLGGWVKYNIPALRVKVRNRDGEYIPGVVATKPPHFMTAAERNSVPDVADMSIDVGSSSREETIKDYKIDTGCPIFVMLNANIMKSPVYSSVKTLMIVLVLVRWLMCLII